MFTGLVEGQGLVREIRPGASSVRLVIEAPASMTEDVAVGASIAINGCCLTVVEIADRRWSFEAGGETLSRTNLGKLKSGDAVNLERSLPANGRLGGHFVQGHVDGKAEVERIVRDGEWVTMWFRASEHLTAQVVPKGSVAIDGVSLTLVEVSRDRFSVCLIPHTLDVTTLGRLYKADPVNVETDILGKYVQKMLSGGQRD